MKILLIVLIIIAYCAIIEASKYNQIQESRGKKKKFALWLYLVDIVVKKIFFLKLIYAFIFWLVIHKAGYFLSWFVMYLKGKKAEYHDHHEHEHDHDYYDHHHHEHYEYGPPGYSSYKNNLELGSSGYSPYRRRNTF